MNPSAASLCAGGKINLRLKVTARRPDGYHELDTIFCPLEFPCDRLGIDFESAKGISLLCNSPEAGDERSNLAFRAAERYAEVTGISPQWQISLEKNIPVAAGCGGGSSDAAAVLTLLNDRYQQLSDTALAELALTLGADVPFFLKRRPLRATGIGERFEEFPLPEKMPEIMVVYPGFPVSAKWAYQALETQYIGVGKMITPADYLAAFADPGDADWDELLRNDLAFALWEKFPLLRLLKEFIAERGAWGVQISGSGSSIFALFGDAAGASACAGALRRSEFNTPYTRIFTGGKEW
ncbi:MAG: 4-(cytidine 5'-diphospho)-2-C-methyl-D-erythritol kinase [Lentisphaerae bacterium]|nr:4-(cytidine 5'-diphospho)-2-C-methyl-D-erythritol kinase [Lentisphaerota bacterium]